MLKQILSSVGANLTLNIPDVPDISSPAKNSTTWTSNVTYWPTY